MRNGCRQKLSSLHLRNWVYVFFLFWTWFLSRGNWVLGAGCSIKAARYLVFGRSSSSAYYSSYSLLSFTVYKMAKGLQVWDKSWKIQLYLLSSFYRSFSSSILLSDSVSVLHLSPPTLPQHPKAQSKASLRYVFLFHSRLSPTRARFNPSGLRLSVCHADDLVSSSISKILTAYFNKFQVCNIHVPIFFLYISIRRSKEGLIYWFLSTNVLCLHFSHSRVVALWIVFGELLKSESIGNRFLWLFPWIFVIALFIRLKMDLCCAEKWR